MSHGTFVAFAVGFQLLQLRWDVKGISVFLGFVSGTSRLESCLLLCEGYSCMQTKKLCDSNTCFSKLLFSIWTNLSAAPFDAGWYGATKVCFTPFFFRKFLKTAAVNCGPLSDTTSSGKPCAANNVHNVLQVLSAVVLFISNISNHFE